jgi:YVTN family beta-propeller protein
MRPWFLFRLLLCAPALVLVLPDSADAGRRRGSGAVNHEVAGHLTFASPQSNPITASPDGSLVAVVNTTSGTVQFLDTATDSVLATTTVGMEPVSVAFKPNGQEAWVSNHVSDSVSVIDTLAGSASRFDVVETIQDVDATGRTRFDEPVGIAFADDTKAYVALSSRNQIAVVDAASYAVTGHLVITAQEPRALAVRNGRLFVAAFESNNQSQLSLCSNIFGSGIVGDACSLGLQELGDFVTNPNLPNAVKNIVIDTRIPDRDLFVFRTSDDSLREAVTGLGTLLYGLAVDSAGNVFLSQTDARNAENGDHGELLAALDNRIFLNQITEVDCSGSDSNPCGGGTRHDLEPLPPAQPSPGDELATPYGIAISADDSTLVVTAAGTSRVFTASASDPSTPLDILDVGAIPRGVALLSDGQGAPDKAYVLDTLGNTVSVVDVSAPGSLVLSATVPVGSDPTPTAVRLGRIAFNDAFASDSGTFSCASCHPDGNTDQLLWRIGGACEDLGCDPGDEPRTTMPVRGLRATLPLHWDGSLGDSFGGPNGSTGSGGNLPANCTDDHSCFRQLVDESLAGVMCDQAGTCNAGGNQLSEQEKDDMATFLASVSYPPARSRRLDDSIGDSVSVTDLQGGNGMSANALSGFEDFFMDQGGVNNPNTCADSDSGCHELPLFTATNSETLQAFDAPTMRGLTDRYLQFSLGTTAPFDILVQANAGINLGGFQAVALEAPIQWSASDGYREITTFGSAFLAFEGVYNVRPLDTFQMAEEMSTGHSGALGRQVTLNNVTTAGCGSTCDGSCPVEVTLEALQDADTNGTVNLRGTGRQGGLFRSFSYVAAGGTYRLGNAAGKLVSNVLTCDDLLTQAQGGTLVATLTARLKSGATETGLQPLIAPVGAACGTGNGPSGNPALPTANSFQLEAVDVTAFDVVFVDGQPTGATVTVDDANDAACGAGDALPMLITISGVNNTGATELLQLRSFVSGLLSNEIPLP